MQKEMTDETTNWPWAVQRAEDASASSSSKSSSHSSDDFVEEDASLCDSQSSHSRSPARGLQFELEEDPFPILPPPVNSQLVYSIPYGMLDREGGVRFFDGSRVNSHGDFTSRLRYVDEVDAVRKQLVIKCLGKLKHD